MPSKATAVEWCGFVVQYTVNDNNPADVGGITDLPVMENEWR